MVKKGFEIFKRGEGTFGLVLRQKTRFPAMNRLLARYPEGTSMEEGEEALFWFEDKDTLQVQKILNIKYWPEVIS